MSTQPGGIEVHEARHYSVRCVALACRSVVSSRPSALTPAARAGSSTSGAPSLRTAAMAVAQSTGERPRHLGHGVLLRAHPPADLGASPAGQHRAPGDVGVDLGPGPGGAVGIATAPQAPGPHEHHRPTGHRQVPHVHAAPAVADGSGPAQSAAHHLGGRLDPQWSLVAHDLVADHVQSLHAQEHSRSLTSIAHVRGPFPQLSTSRRIAGSLTALVDLVSPPPSYPKPRSIA